MKHEIEQWKLPNVNGKEKTTGKKTMKRASETYKTVAKDLIFVLSESWKEKKKEHRAE